eukprot:CAMPEP_0197024658 /NCGR_PEP_ID=MMETSP1384-20130603/5165_1 /TAXON_ID=29189 /ORGANISM="Ammonia sp." /LENGTH=205 /DNA_ID=CAMNT_0042453075 /DNA_START=195 /DNA_END=812 /DNA_ORIENTATION=+
MSTFKFVPNSLPRHTKKAKKFETIEIGFYEMRAYFDDTKGSISSIDDDDEIICNLYYPYCQNQANTVQRLEGGYFDEQQHCFMWKLNALDKVKFVPYILNPEFIATTHVFVHIVNASKSNSLMGHSVISLFNVFPSTLVNREKLRTKYNKSFTDEDGRRRKVNDREFSSAVTVHGMHVGEIKGFIHAQSELVEKHRKISMKQRYT